MEEQKTDIKDSSSQNKDSQNNILVSLIVFIINNFTNILVIVMILLLFYYAYNQYNDYEEEVFVKSQKPERTDILSDFNIREAVNDLKRMQKRILDGISNIA